MTKAFLATLIYMLLLGGMIITLFTLCVIAMNAKIKFYKNMNRFIDDNKDRISSTIADSAAKSE